LVQQTETGSIVHFNCAAYNRHAVLTHYVGEWNFRIDLTK